jgi:tRNA U34 5-methylaminomethyl-2-thiouridine-forming methyltransferase MnmC
MERHILVTGDGSHTIGVTGTNVTYHSTHGAIQESTHIYINAGLRPLLQQHSPLYIFEMGFGTGLNALLTLQGVIAQQQPVYYETIELYPLPAAETQALNYNNLLKTAAGYGLEALHSAAWEEVVPVHPQFSLLKKQQSLSAYLNTPSRLFHLVYFDAFAPDVQPELWNATIFEQLAAHMYSGGVLVTYCSKSAVRKDLEAVGFTVEKLTGPPGKREIIRATKA